MYTQSFLQAIPGPSVPTVIPSNLYAGFKEEYASSFENNLLQYDWNSLNTSPTEEELNYLLNLAENFGFCFL